jgi:hypothetical protein
LRRRLGLHRIRLQVGELKLELIEQRFTLRGLTKPIVPQLPDRELELLNQQRTMPRFTLCRGGPLLGSAECRPLRNDQRMRTRQTDRKRIIKAHHRSWNHKPM